jgi:serine/threonine-protein kinase
VKICTTCGNQWPDETKFCPNDGSTLRSAGGAADLIGSVIADRYHILKKLGEGGMGAVYLGEHVKMGRKSAIKVMTQSMANDPDAIARFNREAANAARISHSNVCAIYDFGETKDGMIYLAMEFIEGEALTDLIEREGALAPGRAASIIEQAGHALQAAHDLGIVHRDLKPDNIMLARSRGGADVVKVVDFGIAKAMSGEEGQKVTKTGLVVGTPEYMSPEQLSGDKLDGRSDIYSLALVFYRMLTGTLPFQADSAQETMIKRLTDDPLPLNRAAPGKNFPDSLQRVMDRALARMPGDRYTSAAEFARDAVRAVGGMAAAAAPAVDTEGATQLISAVPAPGAAQPRAAGRRTVTPDTPVAVAPPTRASSATRAAPPRKTPVVAIAASVAVLAVGGVAAAVMMKGGGTGNASADSTAGAPPVVTGDTSSGAGAANPPRPSNRAGGQRAGGTPARPDSALGTALPNETRPETQPGIAVSVADAFERLDAILDRFSATGQTPAATAAASRDTALAFYNAPGIAGDARAYAAYILANAHSALENRPEALRWAHVAAQLAPGTRAYDNLVTSLSGRQP